MEVSIRTMLKDSGYKTFKIDHELVGEIAKSISKKGVEELHTLNGSYAIVGFMVIGKQVGERVIILGKDDK